MDMIHSCAGSILLYTGCKILYHSVDQTFYDSYRTTHGVGATPLKDVSLNIGAGSIGVFLIWGSFQYFRYY